MSGLTFDTETLRLMNLFEKITHAGLKDCVVDTAGNCVYFVVDAGKAGIAIGRNGSNVRHVRDVIKKEVKIFEFSSDLETFVKNLIPQANEIKSSAGEKGTTVEIRADRGSKAIIIGRDGKNIKIFKELLQRNHNVNELVVR